MSKDDNFFKKYDNFVWDVCVFFVNTIMLLMILSMSIAIIAGIVGIIYYAIAK